MNTKNSINIKIPMNAQAPSFLNSRLDWLDRVKGIAILFVIIGHVYIKDSFPSRIIHALNVPLFFIVSGYLICTKREWERSSREILKKKNRSILFPYFAYSALMMVWLLVRFFLFHYGSVQEMLHCLADIFCLEGISVLWFLSALWIGQLSVLFSCKVLYQRKSQKNLQPPTTVQAAGQPLRTAVCASAPHLFTQTAVLFLLFTLLVFTLIYFISWVQRDFGSIFGSIFQKLILKASRIFARGIAAGSFMLMGALIRLAEENYRQKLHRERTYSVKCKAFCKKNGKSLYLCLSFLLALLGIGYNGLCDFHYLSFGIFPIYFLNAFLGFIVIAFIGRRLSWDKILSFIGQNSLILMGTHLIFLDFINIMAVILSVFAGRYLGDAWEAKLIILLAAEFLLIRLCRRKQKDKK